MWFFRKQQGKEGTTSYPPKDGRTWIKDSETGTWEPIRKEGFGKVNEMTGQISLPPLSDVVKKYTTGTVTPSPLAQCHKFGPVSVFRIKTAKRTKTVVYGGAGREVDLNSVDAILDLSGWNTPLEVSKHNRGFTRARSKLITARQVSYLHLPCDDGCAPHVRREFWSALLEDIRQEAPRRFLICCTGGHGRTGLALSILAALSGVSGEGDPVAFVREHYCYKAVETTTQIHYVAGITGKVIHETGSGFDWKDTTETTGTATGVTSVNAWSDDEVDAADVQTKADIAKIVKEGY